MTEETISQDTQVNIQDIDGISVDTSVLFSNHKNEYKKRIEKRQQKFLRKMSFIRPFLWEGEEILQVTTGCSPASFIEQFLTGWIIYYLKRSLFVVTNRRVFHIPTTQNFGYRNSIAQIVYADCERIFMKGSTLVAEYKNGQKDKFFYMARNERKKLKAVLKEVSLEGEQSTLERTHLCPRCRNPLIKDHFSCPNCSLEFKSKARAKRISIIYPGGGYFYTRHWFLGIGDAFAEVYLTFIVVIGLVGVIRGAAASSAVVIVFGLILMMEKSLSVYHSNHFIKEYIPVDREIGTSDDQSDLADMTIQALEEKPEDILSVS